MSSTGRYRQWLYLSGSELHPVLCFPSTTNMNNNTTKFRQWLYLPGSESHPVLCFSSATNMNDKFVCRKRIFMSFLHIKDRSEKCPLEKIFCRKLSKWQNLLYEGIRKMKGHFESSSASWDMTDKSYCPPSTMLTSVCWATQENQGILHTTYSLRIREGRIRGTWAGSLFSGKERSEALGPANTLHHCEVNGTCSTFSLVFAPTLMVILWVSRINVRWRRLMILWILIFQHNDDTIAMHTWQTLHLPLTCVLVQPFLFSTLLWSRLCVK